MLQLDCQDRDRFPYEPSREEKSTFEYVFFAPTKSYLSTLITKTLPSVIATLVLFVNVGSISYNLYTAPFLDDSSEVEGAICGTHHKRNDWLISASAIIEASMLLGQLIPAAYFLLSVGDEPLYIRNYSHVYKAYIHIYKHQNRSLYT